MRLTSVSLQLISLLETASLQLNYLSSGNWSRREPWLPRFQLLLCCFRGCLSEKVDPGQHLWLFRVFHSMKVIWSFSRVTFSVVHWVILLRFGIWFFWCWQKIWNKGAPNKNLSGMPVRDALISANPPAAGSICCLLIFFSLVTTLGHKPFLCMRI